MNNATQGAKPNQTVEGFKVNLPVPKYFYEEIPQGEFIKEDVLHLSLY